jgi:N-acyl-D-aspartate/D-glutamate deacylase
MHDLVIRGGTIADGSGTPTRVGDIAVDGSVITAVGEVDGGAKRVIDADGLLVTPGWVDIHTHYDGQTFWDPYLSPSSWHGVTTIVMGNCGVGFAPRAHGQEDFLIGMMETVEDIPGAALSMSIKWDWESFPEYLDAIARIKRAIDVGTQVPHCAVRAYVMGERGIHNEEPTTEDIARMAAIVREALKAGALGLSTSRTAAHRAKSKEFVPGTFAKEAELFGIARVLGAVGHGAFQIVSDLIGDDVEMEWITRLSKETGRPATFGAVVGDTTTETLHKLMQLVTKANANGAYLVPQIAARPAAALMGLEASVHPFITHRAYRPLSRLSLEEKVAKLRDPAVRAQILGDVPAVKEALTLRMVTNFDNYFQLGDPPDYEPSRDMSIAQRASRAGKTPQELAYDIMLERGGRELIYMPFTYLDYSLESNREMMLDPAVVLGQGDGGAHCGLICDATMPTFLLTYFVRDRKRGALLPLEFAVKRHTRDTALLYGLGDRGLLAPGMKADINLVDFDNLRMHAPEMVYDLPAGGRRLVQRVDGYRYTIASGEVIFQDGEASGAMPGKLIRGPQTASSAPVEG